jgi:hypothetical protein
MADGFIQFSDSGSCGVFGGLDGESPAGKAGTQETSEGDRRKAEKEPRSG